MSFYESQSWSAGGRQPSWEQPPPPSRSGASSTVSRDDSQAFLSQIEEVERAQDTLMKSGKLMGMGGGPTGGSVRRDSMPMMGRGGFGEFDGRMPGPSRHHSVSEYDGSRSGSASNLQSFYNNQRFYSRGHGGGNEADQMLQAKRKMAAQRERELRNYHQEQQYNRSLSSGGAKSDRSMSPNTMTEEERRELIARQHRALYGNESSLYTGEPGSGRPLSQDARATGPRNGSPLAYDPYAAGQSGEPSVQMPQRDQSAKDSSAGAEPGRANSSSSPSSNPTAFGLFDNAQQSSRTSTASPGGSPPRSSNKTSGGVAPIGTRPTQNQPQPGALNKRSTTPLPSPLSYGFSANESNNNSGANNNGAGNNTNSSNNNNNNNERSTSASSNPSSSVADKGVGLGWGSNSGVWGTGKNTLGVQASVWG